jgi:hypothetical protein
MGAYFLRKYAKDLKETGWPHPDQYDHFGDLYINEEKIYMNNCIPLRIKIYMNNCIPLRIKEKINKLNSSGDWYIIIFGILSGQFRLLNML